MNPISSLRGWTSNTGVDNSEPLLKLVRSDKYGYTTETFLEFVSNSFPTVIQNAPDQKEQPETISAFSRESATDRVTIHPSTSINDFRQRMRELDLPLTRIEYKALRTAVTGYIGYDQPLQSFLTARGFTLEQLQLALQSSIPVVTGEKPFGRRQRRHKKGL